MDGKRLFILLIGQTALLCLALGILGLLLLRQGNRNEAAQDQLVEEVRANSEAIETLRSGLLRLAQDSGEAREALLLPERDYSFLQTEEINGEVENEENPLAPYFSALDTLARHNRDNLAYRAVAELLEREEVEAFLIEEGLFYESVPGGSYRLSRNGEGVADLGYDDRGGFSLEFPGEESRDVPGPGELIAALEDRISRAEEEARARSTAVAELTELTRQEEIQELLGSYALGFAPIREVESGVVLPVVKGRADEIFSIRWSASEGEFLVGDRRTEAEGLDRTVRAYLAEADLRSEQELAVDRRVEELRLLFEDPGFQSYLDTLGLSVEEEPRDQNGYLYFDLSETDGSPAGSLAIQKLNATVWVMDEDDVPLTSLRRFGGSEGRGSGSSRQLDGDIPEITDRLNREGEQTILLIGSNEAMADTIIVVHVNHRDEAIQLISVPRDLYYRGRKVNVLYPSFGGNRFAEELSEITGLEVDGYVAIDMYAFIDAVNIVGGVEVTLEEPLVDPTYRTKDDGRWSTLFYPTGTHNLSGIEALRLARSRHTSSDFGRAERQQTILASLKEKLSSLSARDVGTVYELVRSLLRYVDTNLSSYDLARLVQNSRSYEITEQVVLNTDNILYHTYSNLYYSGKSADEVDEDFYLGAWILLPREDDWNAIRWYIREVLGEGAA
ncbi:MAG: LCP family protein [Alkalispirochaetaceae bacterium]